MVENGEIIPFPGTRTEAQEAPLQRISEVYVPRVVELYADLGVPEEFLAMMGRYVYDTKVAVSNVATESYSEVTKTKPVDGGFDWERRTILSGRHIVALAHAIDGALHATSVRSPIDTQSGAAVLPHPRAMRASTNPVGLKQRVLRTVATDVAFIETTVDALGNCLYMQHKYNKYIPDFNGNYFGFETSVSREFWSAYADRPEGESLEKGILQDHRNLRTGIALLFLGDELLRHGLVSTMTEAQWVTRALAQQYPTERKHKTVTTPLDRDEIALRFRAIYVMQNPLLQWKDVR